MSGSIRDLKVWQEAVGLASDVVRALRPANRREIKSVVEDALHCSTTVAMFIAQGYSCYDPAAQHEQYTGARRELARLETHLAIARQAELLPLPAYQSLTIRMQQVHRLLGGYLIYLDRQIGRAEATGGTTRPESSSLSGASG